MMATPEQGEALAKKFAARQISRIGVVGSNETTETTGPVIEESWVRYLEVDETDWINLDAPPETLNDLLCKVGRLFVPFMIENAKAAARGDKMLECELDGLPWLQETFIYQAKCLNWLKVRYDALCTKDKERLDNVLSGTECEALCAL